MRIVLDTNVVLSALLWRGTPYELLQSIRHCESVRLFTSTTLLEELGEILARAVPSKRLGLLGISAHQLLTDYIDAVELVRPVATPRVVAADPDDDHVIAAAIAAQADLLVSGDRDLLALGSYRGVRIVSPADAAGLLAGA